MRPSLLPEVSRPVRPVRQARAPAEREPSRARPRGKLSRTPSEVPSRAERPAIGRVSAAARSEREPRTTAGVSTPPGVQAFSSCAAPSRSSALRPRPRAFGDVPIAKCSRVV